VPHFGGAFVDFFIQNIAEAFGLKIKSTKRERFGHLCAKADGSGLILVQKAQKMQGASADEQIESIKFMHEIKEYLVSVGFETLDRFFTSVNTGEPYHRLGEEVFTVAVAFDVPQANFSDRDNFLAIIEELSLMHKHLMRANFVSPLTKQATSSAYEKNLALLASHKKKIMKAGKYSDFDMLFLDAYEKFAPYMLMPEAQSGHNSYVCHNLLKEENIYMGKKPIFTNFVQANFGQQQNDLVYIIKRYLKVGGGADVSLAKILNTYSTANPSEHINHKNFIKLLQYPDKFVKLSKDYYSKKRSFAPKAYIARMEECLARGEAVVKWLG